MAVNSAIINIILNVQDKGTGKIDKTTNKVKKLNSGIVGFNRSLFAATALLGTFTMGLRALWRSAEEGADFSYIRRDFKSQMTDGLLNDLRKATKMTVADVDLMRSALKGKRADIRQNSMAEMFGLVREAAKANKLETIPTLNKVITGIGNINARTLASIGIFSKSNAQYQLQQQLLNKINSALTSGMKKRVAEQWVLQKLRFQYGHLLLAQMDAKDVMQAMGAQAKNVKGAFGDLVVHAFKPLMTHIYKTSAAFTTGLLTLGKYRKGIQYFIKHIISATGAIMALWGSFAVLKLMLMPFGLGLKSALAVMIPMAIIALKLKNHFGSWKKTMDAVGTTLETVWQLVSSFSDGKSMIKASTYKRLLELFSAETISRIFGFGNALGRTKEKVKSFFKGSMDFMGRHPIISSLAAIGVLGTGVVGKALAKVRGTFINPMWVKMKGSMGSIAGKIKGVGGAGYLLALKAAPFLASTGLLLVTAMLAAGAGYTIYKFIEKNIFPSIDSWLDKKKAKEIEGITKPFGVGGAASSALGEVGEELGSGTATKLRGRLLGGTVGMRSENAMLWRGYVKQAQTKGSEGGEEITMNELIFLTRRMVELSGGQTDFSKNIVGKLENISGNTEKPISKNKEKR